MLMNVSELQDFLLALLSCHIYGVPKTCSLLVEMVHTKIGGEHTKPQGGNTHNKCGMKCI